jgi:hypothetical protein
MTSISLRTVPVTATLALIFLGSQRVGYATLDNRVRQTGFAIIDGHAVSATSDSAPVEVAVAEAFDRSVARVLSGGFAGLDAIFDNNERLTRQIKEALDNFDVTGDVFRAEVREAING